VSENPDWGQIHAQTFDDHQPDYRGRPAGQPKYFPNLAGSVRRPGQKTIVVCVPCYNEKKLELENTLNSLCHLNLNVGFALDIVILMDGVKPIADCASKSSPQCMGQCMGLCTRGFLTKKFGVQWEDFNLDHPDEPARMLQTTIYESIPDVGGRDDMVRTFSGGGSLATDEARISLLIKRKNYRKHNSHQWFMEAFAFELRADYIFCTDCATTFEKDMLMKLVEQLEVDKQTIAVCGTMRVMPPELKKESRKVDWCTRLLVFALYAAAAAAIYFFVANWHRAYRANVCTTALFPSWMPRKFCGPHAMWLSAVVAPVALTAAEAGLELFRAPWKWFLRRVQTYEVESDHPISKAAWDSVGFLPVLPGPCGLYRAKELLSRSKKYFEIVNKPAKDCGLLLANLKIAEDRIPSLLAVFPMPLENQNSPQDQKIREKKPLTRWVRDAVFYFEAEEGLEALVLQRRRWLNGTNCGTLWTLRLLGTIIGSQHSPLRKLGIVLMLLMQVLSIALMSIGVGIFASILFSSTHFVAAQFHQVVQSGVVDSNRLLPVQKPLQDNATIIAAGATAVYMLCYLLFLFVHRVDQGVNKKGQPITFVGWAWAMIIFLNLLVLAMFGTSLALEIGTPPGIVLSNATVYQQDVNPQGYCINPTKNHCVPISKRCGCIGPGCWTKSNTMCGATCENNGDCGAGESCWAGLNLNGHCTDPEVVETKVKCEAERDCHANEKCWKMCHSTRVVTPRCGRTFAEASGTCSEVCPSGMDKDCGAGEKCYGKLDAAACDTGGSRRVLALVGACMYPVLPILLVLLNVPVSKQSFVEATRGVRLMASSFVPFLLFLPTLVAFFPAYAIQRLDDVSWGNRGAGEAEPEGQKQMKKLAWRFAVLTPLCNIGFTVGMCTLIEYGPPHAATRVSYVMMGIVGYAIAIAVLRFVWDLLVTYPCNRGHDMLPSDQSQGRTERLLGGAIQ
jgi:cellulose synthase/poly-beta-1,6-N-acetylglucosamine synthase-like glycosyltransferase